MSLLFAEMATHTYFYDNSLPAAEPSLCIPKVWANVTEDRIIRCFEVLLGQNDIIDRVDRIPTEDGNWRVFIHFIVWPNTPTSNELRHRICHDDVCKVVYDDPWWWNVSRSRVTKPRHKNGRRPAPYLVPAEPLASISPPGPIQRSTAGGWDDNGNPTVADAQGWDNSSESDNDQQNMESSQWADQTGPWWFNPVPQQNVHMNVSENTTNTSKLGVGSLVSNDSVVRTPPNPNLQPQWSVGQWGSGDDDI